MMVSEDAAPVGVVPSRRSPDHPYLEGCDRLPRRGAFPDTSGVVELSTTHAHGIPRIEDATLAPYRRERAKRRVIKIDLWECGSARLVWMGGSPAPGLDLRSPLFAYTSIFPSDAARPNLVDLTLDWEHRLGGLRIRTSLALSQPWMAPTRRGGRRRC